LEKDIYYTYVDTKLRDNIYIYIYIVKMRLDEAYDFSCATANDVAFKMFYLPSSFKILKGFFAFQIHAFLVSHFRNTIFGI